MVCLFFFMKLDDLGSDQICGRGFSKDRRFGFGWDLQGLFAIRFAGLAGNPICKLGVLSNMQAWLRISIAGLVLDWIAKLGFGGKWQACSWMEIVGLVRNDSPRLGVGYALQGWFGIRFAVSGVDKNRKLDFG